MPDDKNPNPEHWAKMRDYWTRMEEETKAFHKRLCQMRQDVSFVRYDWTPDGDPDPLSEHLQELDRRIGQYHQFAARAGAAFLQTSSDTT